MNRRRYLWAVLVIALTWAALQAAQSLGKVTVTVPGTPVEITAESYPEMTHLYIQALETNAGAIYVGRLGMNKTTLAGVIYKLLPGQTATINLHAGQAEKTSPSDYYLDADEADDAGLCSFD